MMTLWTGFKQQNFASDDKIGPNEEELSVVIFEYRYIHICIQKMPVFKSCLALIFIFVLSIF